MPAILFISAIAVRPNRGQGHISASVLRRPTFQPPRMRRISCRQPAMALSSDAQRQAPQTISPPPQPPSAPSPAPPPDARMFSNVVLGPDGLLHRAAASEVAATALIAGTMIGAGVLALPTVAAPSGFVPSSTALVAMWGYMAATGLLISEVTINTACALGRPSGVSMLSLGKLTLGPIGALITTASYVFLHYAILTAYTSQGGAMLAEVLAYVGAHGEAAATAAASVTPSPASGLLFAGALGTLMYVAPVSLMERLNNALVSLAVAAFAAVVFASGMHADGARLLASHWDAITSGQLIPVLFVSCVFHNVVSTITLRLEGDRAKIRRAILLGSGLPTAMFVLYDATMLGNGAAALSGEASHVAVITFSLLAIATSFIGFVEGLTELCRDARQTAGFSAHRRWPDFLATICPPVLFAGANPDVFLRALDVAGTYGIAVLFGVLPAAMAWNNRRKEGMAEFETLLPGGDAVLAMIAAVPTVLIGSRLWESVSSIVHLH